MFLPLLLALQDMPAKSGPVIRGAAPVRATGAAKSMPVAGEPPRYAQCMDLAAGDPNAAIGNAVQWASEDGGMFARQCLAVAYSNLHRWDAAGSAFEEAAHQAEVQRDITRAATYWAQAGNAWLAAGNYAKARAGFDAALASGTLKGLPLGEAHLDRARVLAVAGDTDRARVDLDAALALVPADPLAWLLSATLARRTHDLPRAHKDIAEALRLAGDEPLVQLEAGNIAAESGDEPGARAAWQQAIKLAPDSKTAESARAALAQFDAPAAAPAK